jgi:hypothetical protein
MEAQPQPELLFDAPVLHIMNSVPPWNAWTTDSHDAAIPDHEILELSKIEDFSFAGQQSSTAGSIGIFDAPILQIMNGVPAWGAENQYN